MELVQPITSLYTASLAFVDDTLPSTSGHGIDVSSWKQGGYTFARLLVYIESDGSARTLDKPSGGAGGPELWTYRKDASGSLKWWLAAYLNGGVICPVPAAGGRVLDQALLSIGDRLALVGKLSGGALTYAFEPVEYIAQLVQ